MKAKIVKNSLNCEKKTVKTTAKNRRKMAKK